MLIKQPNITNNKPSALAFQRICIHNLNQKFDLVEYKWIQHHVRVRDQKGERERYQEDGESLSLYLNKCWPYTLNAAQKYIFHIYSNYICLLDQKRFYTRVTLRGI